MYLSTYAAKSSKGKCHSKGKQDPAPGPGRGGTQVKAAHLVVAYESGQWAACERIIENMCELETFGRIVSYERRSVNSWCNRY